MINWKAMDHGIPEIAVIAQSLARFYKLSLNEGKDIVSLSDEINHIKTYVQIQNLRFDNRIKLEVNLDDQILQHQILKLILQPIVENSIIHGTLENRDKRYGCITITGRLERDDLLLYVQDDGKGMTEDKAMSLLQESGTHESHGYGIRNINHRIKLCYGNQYGLTYTSALNNGTRVEIKIPAQSAR
jgi:two-component system sensor histidine kinase YesM